MQIQLTEEQQKERGQLIADVLKLRKDPEHKDRYQTTWGTKTALGIFLVVERIIQEGK